MSPFSKKQVAWAHTPAGEKALGSATVNKWDKEVKGKKLPERSKGAHESDLKKKKKKS
jgi:hypothetical protein